MACSKLTKNYNFIQDHGRKSIAKRQLDRFRLG